MSVTDGNAQVAAQRPAPDVAALPAGRLVLLAVVVGLGLGAVTAWAQGWLPDELGSLANSAGPWAVVAFLLALLAGRPGVAVLVGAGTLAALLAGYVLAAAVRGDASSDALILFWGLAAVTVGPVLGLAAYAARRGPPLWAALGVATMSVVLIGEGAYGLLTVADTTYPPFWAAEALIGGGLLVGWLWLRRPGPRPALVAIVVAALLAAAYVVVARQDLIGLL